MKSEFRQEMTKSASKLPETRRVAWNRCSWRPADTLILDLEPPELWDSKFPLFKPLGLCCFVLTALANRWPGSSPYFRAVFLNRRVLSPTREHLARPGDTFGCHSWEVLVSRGRDAAKHPVTHGTISHSEELSDSKYQYCQDWEILHCCCCFRFLFVCVLAIPTKQAETCGSMQKFPSQGSNPSQ